MRAALALAAPLLAVVLAGCSGGSSGSDSEPEAAPAFNPCDSLDADAISAALGATVTLETGDVDTPRCTLVPAQEGDPTFDLSYLWFDQGLDAAWKTINPSADAPVTTPDIPGADDARVVSYTADAAYAVSAFLQNGALIQTVNAMALDPSQAPAVDAAMTEILTELSAGAPSSSKATAE
ncbi:hypothetical protein [Nocardioides sp.]|uniref:hypothetical protein n=1 Tax=Nocardioides sp. TaxID=35761 RepID=UPI0039E2CB35